MFLKCPQDKLTECKWLGANTAPLLEGNAKCEPLQKRETVQADLLGATVQVPRSPAPSAPSPMQTNGEHFTRETMEATRAPGSNLRPRLQEAAKLKFPSHRKKDPSHENFSF